MGSQMNVLDLFSGIGGFSLGLERAGMRTIAFCEIEPYCRAVLRQHWPDVPVFDDVRTLRFDSDTDHENEHGRTFDDETRPRLSKSGAIDLICGGFPCQDISVAGKGAGLKGERSGLWKEFARIIGEVRPRYVIVENVSALLSRGLGDVLGDLASLGYDAEWHCIPASAVGAPHRRDRVWIVAYPSRIQQGWQEQRAERQRTGPGGEPVDVAHANSNNEHRRSGPLQMGWGQITREIADNSESGRTQWLTEPGVGRVAHGVRNRVDRLKGLGNAVVPQIPEIIGKAIMSHEHERIS
jgi:DNA (cytosine-5)-methyltransferase 1